MEIPPLITTVFNAVSSHVNKFKDLSKTQKILSVVFGVLGLPFLIVGGPLAAAFAVEAFYRFNQGNIKQQTGKENEIVQVTKDKAAEILNKKSATTSSEDSVIEGAEKEYNETVEVTQETAPEIFDLRSSSSLNEPRPSAGKDLNVYSQDQIIPHSYSHEDEYFVMEDTEEEDTELDSLSHEMNMVWNYYDGPYAEEDDLVLKVKNKFIDFSKESDFKIDGAEKYLLSHPPSAHVEEGLKSFLEKQNLIYVGVPSDGDCFYNSICTQLKGFGIDQNVTPKKLRSIVVEEAEMDPEWRNALIKDHQKELIQRQICTDADFDEKSNAYSLDSIWSKLKPELLKAVEDDSVNDISNEEITTFKEFWSTQIPILNTKRDQIRNLFVEYQEEEDASAQEAKSLQLNSALEEYLQLEKTLRGKQQDIVKKIEQPLWGGTVEAFLIQKHYNIYFSIIDGSSGVPKSKEPLTTEEDKLSHGTELNLIFLGWHYLPAWDKTEDDKFKFINRSARMV